MGMEGKAQEAREQAEAKLREERKKAAQRSGRAGDEADDKVRQEKARQEKVRQEKVREQQAEAGRRDTLDEDFEV